MHYVLETLLEQKLGFVIQGHVCAYEGTEGDRGGCATFVRQRMSYREIRQKNVTTKINMNLFV